MEWRTFGSSLGMASCFVSGSNRKSRVPTSVRGFATPNMGQNIPIHQTDFSICTPYLLSLTLQDLQVRSIFRSCYLPATPALIPEFHTLYASTFCIYSDIRSSPPQELAFWVYLYNAEPLVFIALLRSKKLVVFSRALSQFRRFGWLAVPQKPAAVYASPSP